MFGGGADGREKYDPMKGKSRRMTDERTIKKKDESGKRNHGAEKK